MRVAVNLVSVAVPVAAVVFAVVRANIYIYIYIYINICWGGKMLRCSYSMHVTKADTNKWP